MSRLLLPPLSPAGCFVPLPFEKPRTEASDAMQWGFEVMDIDFVPPGGHHFVECNKVLVQKLIVPLHNLAKGNGSDDRREDFARILYETMETFQAMGMSICDIDRVLSFATHPLLMLACDVLRDCFPYVVDFFMELRSVWKAGAFALIGSKIHAAMIAKGYFETDGFTGFTKLCEWSLTFAVGDPFPIVGGAPVGQMFKWKKNFDKSGVDAPPRSIVGTRLNLERLEEYTCGLLDELLSDHMVLAGGILMKTLCGKDYGTSDLDLWFVGLTELDQVLAELDRAMSVCRKWNKSSEFNVTRHTSTLSVTVQLNEPTQAELDANDRLPACRRKELRKFLKIQFPMRAFKCVEQVVLSFDLGIVQLALVKVGAKKHVVMTALCQLELSTLTCLVNPTMSTLTRRHLKIFDVGHTLLAPRCAALMTANALICETPTDALRTIVSTHNGSLTALLCAIELYKRRALGKPVQADSYSCSTGSSDSHMNEPVPVPWVGQSWRSNVEKYIELSDPAKRMYGSREVYIDLAAIGQAMQVSADFVNSIMAMSS